MLVIWYVVSFRQFRTDRPVVFLRGHLPHLYREIIRAKERLRYKKEIIQSCSRQSGALPERCGGLVKTALQLFPSLSHTYVVHLGYGPVVHSTQMTFPKTGSLPQEAPG